jgi:hypothetical protein
LRREEKVCLQNPRLPRKDRETFNYEIGGKVHGYTVKDVTHLPERNLTAYELLHDRTGTDEISQT